MNRLENKVCIVTGASSGIGAKTAEVFAAEGAKVVMAARREAEMKKIAAKIEKAGGEALVVPTDIRDLEQVKALVAKTMEVYGRVDVLDNVAGFLDVGMRPIEEFLDEDLVKTVNTNLKGTLQVTRECAKVFVEQGYGTIATVASMAGATGNGSAAYCASKGALVAMTQHIALRFAGKGPKIRANCICPGTVWTPMAQKAQNAWKKGYSKGAKAMNESVFKHTNLDCPICYPIDIANLLLFLSSEESACLTGQVLRADFGCNL